MMTTTPRRRGWRTLAISRSDKLRGWRTLAISRSDKLRGWRTLAISRSDKLRGWRTLAISRSDKLRGAGLLLAGLALTAGLVGCSSGGSSSSNAGTAGGPAAGPAPAQADNQGGAKAAAPHQGAGAGGAAQGAQPGGAPGAQQGKPDQAPAGRRSIVYTGSITVRVDDVNAAAAQLVTMATGAGGFVGGDQRTIDSGKSVATLTLRIPADKFSGTVDQIGKLGREQSRQVSTQDVTAQVIDLAARIQAQQASVDRVRALLAKAQSISEITSIESELARRESDLESLQAQQRNLDDLTALSTVSATLLGPDAATPPPPKQPETGFLVGLRGGWHAFVASVQVILTVIGALLPFAVVLGVPVLLVLAWARRRGRRAAPPAPPAPAAQPAAAGSAAAAGSLSSATTSAKTGSEG